MRILALDLGADWRGGQRQTSLTTAGLAGRGHEVLVLARRGSPLAREIAGRGAASLAELPAGSEWSPRLLAAVARAARRFRPDVLYAGDGRSHGAAVWSGAARHAPLVVHRRVTFSPAGNPFSRYKYRVPRLYLAVAGAVRDALVEAGVRSERIVVLPDGLPAGAFVSRPACGAPPFRLAHVGAFDGRKGQEVVVDVVARLAAEGLDVTALFLGDGPARDRVAAHARSRGVLARCTFAGMVDDVAERLATCHALLLPSDSEGAALALSEAMAAGCAVIAHDVGGSSELLGGGEAGLLLPDLDAARWAEAVRRLLRDPDARARLVEAGRAAAAERTLDRTVQAVERELARAAAA